MHTATNEMKIDSLVTRINEFAESQTNYYLTNTDNSIAEFVASFFYGEADSDEILRSLRDNCEDTELVEAIKAKFHDDKNGLRQFLSLHSELDQCGIYVQSNEFLSAAIGEVEEQLPDDIAEAIAQLSEMELDEVISGIDTYLDGDRIYIDLNYDRWILILDTESARQTLGME
jgi:hypothetical protein